MRFVLKVPIEWEHLSKDYSKALGLPQQRHKLPYPLASIVEQLKTIILRI